MATWSNGLIALLLSSVAMVASAATPQQTAQQFVDRLEAGDIAGAEAMFTPDMAKAAPAASLQALWQSLGTLEERGAQHVVEQQGMQIVVQTLRFATASAKALITVDAQGRIAGLLLQPADADAAPPPAPPTDAPYSERELQIDAGKGPLPATLTVPHGTGPFRAVVMVHGSGPHDRNETVGPNRPFLDVARGLAAQGIAVLRHEKRTLARPQDFRGDFTMDDETTDDAVAAVALLARTPGIDPKHVYVMGHSQGGMLAPRIASHSGKVAGLVLWSAPARSLLTLLPEQNRYLLNLDGEISAADQVALDRLDAQIASVRGTAAVAAKDLPLGQPASYWRAFDRIDPVADAQALAQPILLLQGGRDFQVTDVDWQRWQRGLPEGPKARFHRYPALNHLGIAGEGPGSLQEYSVAGHVSTQLVDDVAVWIRAQP
ncbi:alpha/beta fold hydrolase [Stenotrophomonas sp. ISL-67]|uniref:alpha/beta hydrolase n=1 Tax=Stenotrophomonas sp. ISL-67 TaxID=2819171 RepID=UPI001BE8E1F1|nr:alpha/beta fold hydrolase [Stenotrophomonas sp. ISL-67]MBT2766319.1 alpha/beta fold hydrolase [Stenotrophomonas sp. ISL-67]